MLTLPAWQGAPKYVLFKGLREITTHSQEWGPLPFASLKEGSEGDPSRQGSKRELLVVRKGDPESTS